MKWAHVVATKTSKDDVSKAQTQFYLMHFNILLLALFNLLILIHWTPNVDIYKYKYIIYSGVSWKYLSRLTG